MAETQAEMFPDDVPEFARAYWKAVRRWYGTGTSREPTREEFCRELKPPMPLRTFDRKKRKPDNARWLGTWPPKRGQLPPWEQPHGDAPPAFDHLHPCKKLQVLVVENDGSIRPIPAVLDLIDGMLRVENLIPALVSLRNLTMISCAYHHLVHHLTHAPLIVT